MNNQRSPFRVCRPSNLIRNADQTEFLVYDEIGFFGITAKDVANELSNIDTDTIHLRINSPGGDVFDGVAIYNQLRNHPAEIVTHIDGLAASIASVIALAGDEVRMASNAFFMVHNPWGVTVGDAEIHRKMADTLEKIGQDSIARTYMAKTGAAMDTVTGWMDDETWFNSTDAKDAGLVDAVDEEIAEEQVAAAFDLSIYDHVPEKVAARMRTGQNDRITVTWGVDGDGAPAYESGALSFSADELRAIEATLRDEGLSRKDAVTALSGLKKWYQRDADMPDDAASRRGEPGDNSDALIAARTLLSSMAIGSLHHARWNDGRHKHGRVDAHHERDR